MRHHVIRSCSASNTSFVTWRPSLCSCWTTHMEHYLSSSLTARHFSPSRNISRLVCLVYLFIARFDSVKCPCSSLGRLRRYNFVKLHYITTILPPMSDVARGLAATCQEGGGGQATAIMEHVHIMWVWGSPGTEPPKMKAFCLFSYK